jgi:hypothetical protein
VLAAGHSFAFRPRFRAAPLPDTVASPNSGLGPVVRRGRERVHSDKRRDGVPPAQRTSAFRRRAGRRVPGSAILDYSADGKT